MANQGTLVLAAAGLLALGYWLSVKDEAKPKEFKNVPLPRNAFVIEEPKAPEPVFPRAPEVSFQPVLPALAETSQQLATSPAAQALTATNPLFGIPAGIYDFVLGGVREQAAAQKPAETSGIVVIVTGKDAGSQTILPTVKGAIQAVGLSVETMDASAFTVTATVARSLGVSARKVNYLVLGGWLTPGFETGLGSLLLRLSPDAQEAVTQSGDVFIKRVDLGIGAPVFWAFGWTAKDSLNAGLEAVRLYFGEVGTAEPTGGYPLQVQVTLPPQPSPAQVIPNYSPVPLPAPPAQLRLLSGDFASPGMTARQVAEDAIRRSLAGESGFVDAGLRSTLERQLAFLLTVSPSTSGESFLTVLSQSGLGFDTGVIREGMRKAGLI
ncbi:hypothetical protein HY572_00945 [Candidatus Micrarchaeota archaeon]|nr:hypothetical protein [Candidatus Micrarchaeota archaeon]